MSIFNNVSRKFKALTKLGVGKVEDLIGQVGNLEADEKAKIEKAVATCAGLALSANGEYKAEEHSIMDTMLDRSRFLKTFNKDSFQERVNDVVGDAQALGIDFAIHNNKDDLEILRDIKALGNEALLLTVLIAAADGEFDADEAAVIKMLIEELKREVSDFPKVAQALSNAARPIGQARPAISGKQQSVQPALSQPEKIDSNKPSAPTEEKKPGGWS